LFVGYHFLINIIVVLSFDGVGSGKLWSVG
jgi:hypothetical protein